MKIQWEGVARLFWKIALNMFTSTTEGFLERTLRGARTLESLEVALPDPNSKESVRPDAHLRSDKKITCVCNEDIGVKTPGIVGVGGHLKQS